MSWNLRTVFLLKSTEKGPFVCSFKADFPWSLNVFGLLHLCHGVVNSAMYLLEFQLTSVGPMTTGQPDHIWQNQDVPNGICETNSQGKSHTAFAPTTMESRDSFHW